MELNEYLGRFAWRLSRRILRAHRRYAVDTPANDNHGWAA